MAGEAVHSNHSLFERPALSNHPACNTMQPPMPPPPSATTILLLASNEPNQHPRHHPRPAVIAALTPNKPVRYSTCPLLLPLPSLLRHLQTLEATLHAHTPKVGNASTRRNKTAQSRRLAAERSPTAAVDREAEFYAEYIIVKLKWNSISTAFRESRALQALLTARERSQHGPQCLSAACFLQSRDDR